jgi:cell division protease FtsH
LAYQQQQNGFLGPMANQRLISPQTLELIDKEIKQIVEAGHQKALAILRANRELLEAMAEKLLDQEVMEGEVLQQFLSQIKVPQPVS